LPLRYLVQEERGLPGGGVRGEEPQLHGWLGADTTLTSLQSRAEKSCGSRACSVCKAWLQAPRDALDPHQPPTGCITRGVWSVFTTAFTQDPGIQLQDMEDPRDGTHRPGGGQERQLPPR